MRIFSLSHLLICKLLLITGFFLLSNKASAQVIDPQFLSVTDGLSSNDITSVFQDSYGLIWIGTYDGLHVYDGYQIEIFKNIPGKTSSIQDNVIRRILEDKDNNLWIANDLGISMYNRATNRFVNYNLLIKFGESTHSAFRVIDILYDSNNRLWLTTDNRGVILYDPATNTFKHVDNLVNEKRTPMLNSFTIGLTEDSKGKIWIGDAEYGLLSYDSKDSIFVPITFNKQESVIDFTRAENQITYLYNDANDIIWIAARNGIYKYNPRQNNLKTIIEYNYLQLDWNNLWNHIMPDNQGNIWIGNNFRGILKFDGISDEYREIIFSGHHKNPDAKSDISITLNLVDKTGIIWFGTTSHGLIKYDPNDKPFIHYAHDETNKASISNNQIFALQESKVLKGKIYVGTSGGGLDLFDQNNKTFSQIKYKDDNDLVGLSVKSIVEESNGSLWLATWGNGLLEMNSEYRVISHFKKDSSLFNSLADNYVRVIRKDGNSNLWIGTRSGLNILNRKTKRLKRIASVGKAIYPDELLEIATNLIESKNPKSRISEVTNEQDIIEPFEVDKPGTFLIVSSGESEFTSNSMFDYGFLLNAENDTIWSTKEGSNSFYAGGADKNRINIALLDLMPGKYTLCYISDDSHCYNNWNEPPPIYPELWGIHLVEFENKAQIASIKKYINQATNQLLIKGENIKSIHTSDKNVWIGTSGGLNKISLGTNTVTTYLHDENTENSVSSNNVQYIYEDKNGILWLATNGGLNRFDPLKETFKNYSVEDGLPTNLISSILTGIDNDLWVSTVNGFSKMISDAETGKVTFVNYDLEDGLGGMDFNIGAGLVASNGEYFFGGNHGLNSFSAKKSNFTEPSLIFSDIKIFNKSIKPISSNKTPLIEIEELELPYNKNDLTFEFAVLHYSAPNKNQYAHKLSGYDKNWIYNFKRDVSYTNLDPGEYVFSIKGSNRDGVWSTSAKSIHIKINPPWWFTTWAYIAYVLLFLGIIFAIDRIQRKRLLTKAKEKMKIQEAELRAQVAELQTQNAEKLSKVIQAESERKTKELEEARQLQLSMLPRELPKLPHLDIAVYMKTASEVGGDYYDFSIKEDGSLNIAIGDATGHGMKAGIMVSAMKSIFMSNSAQMDIEDFFLSSNKSVKSMNLQRVMMGFAMLNIEGTNFKLVNAGMPPVFLFRNKTGTVEEIKEHGLPIGAMNQSKYIVTKGSLVPGDAILLMSDGMPELQDAKNEMYGYKRIRFIFEDIVEKEPEEIINSLKDEGSAWVNDQDPDDDVTFVVIKVK